jgi:transposase
MKFLRRFSELVKRFGIENVVCFDESGFDKHSCRKHGGTLRGQTIFADVPGRREKRTNLIMAQRDGRWLAPETFEGTCKAPRVNEWLQDRLLPLLRKPGIVVFDNASFHKKKEIKAILKKEGHVPLPLPPYSPDFNPIENSFGGLKRKREFAPQSTTIPDLIKSSNYYLEGL